MRETVLVGVQFPPPNAIGFSASIDVVDPVANAASRIDLWNTHATGQIILTDVTLYWPVRGMGGRVIMAGRQGVDTIGTAQSKDWLDRNRAGSPAATVQHISATSVNAGDYGSLWVGPEGRKVELGIKMPVQSLVRFMPANHQGGLGVIFRWFEP